MTPSSMGATVLIDRVMYVCLGIIFAGCIGGLVFISRRTSTDTELRYQIRYTSKVTALCAPSDGCVAWDSCADMAPRDVKAEQALVSSKIEGGYLICEWRNR